MQITTTKSPPSSIERRKSDAPLSQNDVLSAPVRLTVLTSKSGPLTKQMTLASDGKVEKRPAAPLVLGTAHPADAVEAGSTAKRALERLAGAIGRLEANQALMTGLPPAGRAKWDIVTTYDKRLNPDAGVIARTNEHFRAISGPAFFPLDFDVKDYPTEIKSRLVAAGGLEAVMRAVCPGLGEAARLVSPSASSHVLNPVTGESTGAAGEHWYFVLTDGEATTGLAKSIAARLEAAGWVWGHVSAAGTVVHKTLIDTAASDPTRIWYEAKPVLAGGLSLSPAKTLRLVEGRAIRPDDVSPLTSAEDATRQQNRARASDAVTAQAAQVKAAREASLIRKRVALGESPDAAEKAVKAAQAGVLMGDFEVVFDDSTSATVREILDNPAAFNRKTCPDPLEPEYGGGRNLGVLQTGHPAQIFSQAHGGTVYRLYRDDAERAKAERGPRPEDFFRNESPTQPKAERGFRLMRLGEIEDRDPEYLIDDLIETDSLAQIFGEPGAGKSFTAVDVAASVATGRAFHGRKVKRGAVAYVAGEGRNGLKRRFRAWGIEHGEDIDNIPLALSNTSAGLSDPAALAEVLKVLEAFAAEHGPIALIVVDTLARNFGGGDENDTRDMNRFVAALDRLKDRFPGCTVLVVHHTGHGDKTRARGAKALNGALDTEYRVDKSAETLVLTNTKVKEGPTPAPLHFRTKVVELGLSKAGKPVTSLVLEAVSAPLKVVVERISAGMRLGLSTFAKAQSAAGPGSAVHLEVWREAFYAAHTGDGSGAKRKAFNRARGELVDRGYLSVVDDSYVEGAEAWPV
ncbi:MAG: helicase RepA family protein [Pseudomonadota bacterium]